MRSQSDQRRPTKGTTARSLNHGLIGLRLAPMTSPTPVSMVPVWFKARRFLAYLVSFVIQDRAGQRGGSFWRRRWMLAHKLREREKKPSQNP